MKLNCLSFQVKEHKKFERLLFTVPGYIIYQSYKALKILKIKAKSADMKQGNQLKSI